MARKGLYLGGSALLLAVVLLLVFWGRPADAEIQVLKAPRAVVWKDFLGVNAQFLWFSPERYNKQIDRLQDLGLEWVRLDLHWDRLETAEDQYQLASLDQLVKDLEARQLKSVFYLVGSARFITTAPFYSPFQDQYPPRDPEVFARRMAMLSQRYPSVAAWQVWNEPNLIGFWRPKADPEGYAKLLQASTIALRMVDPEKPVVSAGMAFFSEMPDGRTMFDALGHLGVESLGTIATYHPYTQLPEGNYPWNLDFVSHANQINRALRNAGVPAIWSTEWGWSAYKGPKELQDIIGVEGQADYVLRRLALMSALDYDRIFLFTLSDLDQRASVRDRDYGLLDLDANPKPVYLALQRFLKVTGPKLRPADPPVTEDLPDGSFSIGWTREDFRRLAMEGKFAIVMSMLNAYPLGDDLSQLDKWAARGVRMFGFNYVGNNDWSDSSRPLPFFNDTADALGGLSPLGKQAVERLNDLGVIIDVSQMSTKALEQVAALSRAPIVASHSAPRALVDIKRNLSDHEMQLIKDSGGVIQVVGFPAYLRPLSKPTLDKLNALRARFDLPPLEGLDYALMPGDPIITIWPEQRFGEYASALYGILEEEPKAGLKELVDAIDYTVKKVGIDHVGISSDFNDGGGVDGWKDVSEIRNVTAELITRGYSDADIAKLWGGNFLRAWGEVQKRAKPTATP